MRRQSPRRVALDPGGFFCCLRSTEGSAEDDPDNENGDRWVVCHPRMQAPRTGEENRKNRPETRQFRGGCTNEMKRRLLCQKWVSTKRKNGPSS